MADVFISYHETSAGELAEQIADALDAAGIPTWCARRDLGMGEVFAEEIPKQIHACRLFLLILNENVYNSAHIQTEVGIAFSRVHKGENIRIFPLEIGECPLQGWLEYYLIHPQSVKFPATPDEQRLQWLVKRIAKALKREPQPVQPTQPDPPPVKEEAKPTPTTPKIIKRGDCGDNVTYTLDEKGVLTISGRGPMRDFEGNRGMPPCNTPWRDERQNISSVEIQDGVTRIGWGAFEGCVELASVIIPESVTEIRGVAFHSCMRLTSVTIPYGVTEIGWYAFYDCTELESVIIPDSVTNIEYKALYGCTSLKSVSVPAKAEIEDYAFPDWTHVELRW